MKTFLQVTQSISILFAILITLVITLTNILSTPRRAMSDESLLEMIGTQAVLLSLYFIAKIGIYICNTYKIERIR